ncbi:MAG TPA: complex I NDUFA9 subunit family protein [Brevundimonas sp.]|jgi:NADH dehydrogenase|uniref:complex I NDUFA9 subunit family protein n=1 Tax=Brevundimonas sp. TaxID=1871086 RepID=UPI002DE441C8|nr:complex I NDUFA9 subunit family protein [Brevundimonas sp.]
MVATTKGLVTVFGGSGFVGTQAVRVLARRGWRVRVAVRNPNLAVELRPAGDPGQIQLVRCDVSDAAQVAEACRGAQAVVNLIGVLFESGKRGFDAMHVDAARRIAEQARAAGVGRFVQMSAIGADADGKSQYARTKAAGEAAVRDIFPDAVVLRPSVVFGPGDGFLNRFAGMASYAPALPLVGFGKTKFQPVYVGDVAEAVARSVEDASLAGRTFELGGPAVLTFEEVLQLVLRETGRRRLLAPLPFPVARAIGSVAQLSAFLGIPPLLTRDQVLSLETDNVVAEGAEGLAALGVQPTGMEAVVPSYLWRYRRGGQFAEKATF